MKLNGLVLTGGESRRMGRDKALLAYGPEGHSQIERAMALLAPLVKESFLSVRPGQQDAVRQRYRQIPDQPLVDNAGKTVSGPAAGLLAAHAQDPDAAWLVLACDLPLLDEATLCSLVKRWREVVAKGNPVGWTALAYRSTHDGLPEPLCTLWTPEALAALGNHVAEGHVCPRKALLNSKTLLLEPENPHALDNANTAEERAQAERRLERRRAVQAAQQGVAPTVMVQVTYFAQLRDVAGMKGEAITTAHRTAGPLYDELRQRHGFPFECQQLRLALNDSFAEWDTPLKQGDVVVFIPPVTGG
ncbi:NTP transferase domain-containing protein [Formicincola oecophyllae]|uniref:Molybdenum cofactor guanylyltransferase n=2 Tax=Formicincola oecophyllae TaxID=2558361 RepID=A0A4Y6UA71_9PROT|nr:NTP transferase domain-containing protein [Formicincola oecophyllae]